MTPFKWVFIVILLIFKKVIGNALGSKTIKKSKELIILQIWWLLWGESGSLGVGETGKGHGDASAGTGGILFLNPDSGYIAVHVK